MKMRSFRASLFVTLNTWLMCSTALADQTYQGFDFSVRGTIVYNGTSLGAFTEGPDGLSFQNQYNTVILPSSIIGLNSLLNPLNAPGSVTVSYPSATGGQTQIPFSVSLTLPTVPPGSTGAGSLNPTETYNPNLPVANYGPDETVSVSFMSSGTEVKFNGGASFADPQGLGTDNLTINGVVTPGSNTTPDSISTSFVLRIGITSALPNGIELVTGKTTSLAWQSLQPIGQSVTFDAAGGQTVIPVVMQDSTSPGSIVIANSGLVANTIFIPAYPAIIFTGNNTYTGGTTINAGATLQLGSGGTSGAITGNVANSGALLFDRADTIVYTGAVSGTGSLTQMGTGTVTLTGTNTYTGGTTVNAGGTLQIGAGGTTGSITGNVADNGAVVFNRADSITFAGVVSGTGSLTQAGTGTLTLTGANTYTGGTTINPGATLQIGTNGAITGNVTDNGALVFNQPAAIAFPGAVSGTGSLTQAGSSLLTLTGANTYTGGTTVNAGATLALSGSGSIASSAGVTTNGVFDISGTSAGAAITSLAGSGQVALGSQTLTLTNAGDTFTGSIAGSGGLTLAAGTEVLAGGNSYSGLTTVGQGAELVLVGTLASPVTVERGGTLRALGAIGGALSVAGGGTLAVGASPAPLIVTAPVSLAAGTTTSFDIDGSTPGMGAGHYSQLLITGAGNTLTAGGTLVPVLRGITGNAYNSYTPALGQQLVLISAQGGVLGSFSGLTQPASGLASGTRFDTIYGPTTLSLVATPAAYANLPAAGLEETSSQSSVGAAVDAARPTAGLRMSNSAASFFDPLYALPAAAIAPALGQLAPTIYGDGMMAARQTSYAVADTVMDQIAARRDGISPDQTAPGPHGSTVWLSGLGQFGDTGTGGGGYHTSMGGAVAGIDKPVIDGVLVGATVAGTSTHTSGDGGTDSSAASQLGLYGEVAHDRLFLDGQAYFIHVDQDVHRNTSVWGTAAKGDGHVNGGGGQLMGGIRLATGRWQIDPQVGLRLLSLTGAAVREDTGGAAAESVGGRDFTSLQSFVGARFATVLQPVADLPVTVHGVVGWDHESRDTDAHADASLAFAPGAGFSVEGAPIARDAARLGGGVEVAVAPAAHLFAAYQAELGRASTSQNLSGGLRVTW